MKKNIMTVAIAFALAVFLVMTVRTEASVNYGTTYENFAKKLSKRSDKKLYMAVVESDDPVLLITDITFDGFGTDQLVSTCSKIYQYSQTEGKVVYIGKFNSTSTSTPLVLCDNAIQRASHHSVYSLQAKDGVGHIEGVKDVDINNIAPKKLTYTMQNNKINDRSSQTISEEESMSMFNENYNYDKGELINFEPIGD